MAHEKRFLPIFRRSLVAQTASFTSSWIVILREPWRLKDLSEAEEILQSPGLPRNDMNALELRSNCFADSSAIGGM